MHLNARDVNLVAISKATLGQIEAYRSRMGWTFKWVSSHDNDFNADFHVGFSEDEKARNEIYYNYTTTRRAPSAGKSCPAPASSPGTKRTRCSTLIQPTRGASTCSTVRTTFWTSYRKGGMRTVWTGSRRGFAGMTSINQQSCRLRRNPLLEHHSGGSFTAVHLIVPTRNRQCRPPWLAPGANAASPGDGVDQKFTECEIIGS